MSNEIITRLDMVILKNSPIKENSNREKEHVQAIEAWACSTRDQMRTIINQPKVFISAPDDLVQNPLFSTAEISQYKLNLETAIQQSYESILTRYRAVIDSDSIISQEYDSIANYRYPNCSKSTTRFMKQNYPLFREYVSELVHQSGLHFIKKRKKKKEIRKYLLIQISLIESVCGLFSVRNKLVDLITTLNSQEYYDEQAKPERTDEPISQSDFLNNTGVPEETLQAYEKQEKQNEADQASLGLANVLKSRGDLLRQMGQLEPALQAYVAAEELFVKEYDRFGLANALKSHGDLLSQMGQLEAALEAYAKAERLFTVK